MIDKRIPSPERALAAVADGDTVMIGGFGEAGSPVELLHALIDLGAAELTVVSNNAGSGEVGLAALIRAGRVAKIICSYPRSSNSTVFPDVFHDGRIELELVPQGTLAERIRAGGAGIPAFYTPTAVGTELAVGKGMPRIRWTSLPPRACARRRLGADKGSGRGLARQPHVQQDSQEFRAADGHGR